MDPKEYSKVYYLANREKIRATSKANYEANREKYASKNKEYIVKNKEHLKTWYKQYYIENRSYLLEKQKKYEYIKYHSQSTKSNPVYTLGKVASKTAEIEANLAALLIKKQAFIKKLSDEALL